MRVDISLLPALAATFMLVFARVGAMVMLLPGFGESNIPVHIKLAIALLLTLIILPLQRSAYQVDLTSMSSLGVLIGNFLSILGMTLLFATDSHHLVISALNESYRIFSPGEVMPSGDVAALATRAFATAFKIGLQLSAPFLVFGLVFNIGLGVLARLMPAMQVYFVGVPLSIMIGFVIFGLVLAGMMGTYLDYFTGVMRELTPLK